MAFTVSARWAVILLALPVTLAVARGVRDLGEYSHHSRELDKETTAADEYDLASGQVYSRLEIKLAVADDYAAGRLTLRAAARRFLSLSGDERALDTLRQAWPNADDDEERCAASVVRYLQQQGDQERPTTPAYRRAVADFTREYGSAASLHTAP